MTTQPKTGIRQYLAANIWVILVDITGALLLLSLLLTAAGAPALKEWMFVLLTVVPVMALITMLAPRRQDPAAGNQPQIRPVLERKIVISPRPFDQRADQAA